METVISSRVTTVNIALLIKGIWRKTAQKLTLIELGCFFKVEIGYFEYRSINIDIVA